MTDYEKYEVDCEKIRARNKQLLTEFEQWLELAGLSTRTISNHVDNIDLYINEYLLYEEAQEAEYGVSGGEVDMFLGYWFIKKATWAGKSAIKGNATSLKKFYTFMLEEGLVTPDEVKELKETINPHSAYFKILLKPL